MHLYIKVRKRTYWVKIDNNETNLITMNMWLCGPIVTVSFIGGRNYPEKTADVPQVANKLYHIKLYRVHLAWAEFELTTLVVIGTDCTCSCKSNYHTITTTTTPCKIRDYHNQSSWIHICIFISVLFYRLHYGHYRPLTHMPMKREFHYGISHLKLEM
jgi:hypothetical protein